MALVFGEHLGVLWLVARDWACELSSRDVVASWSSELEFSSSEFFLTGLCFKLSWVFVLSFLARRRSTDRLFRKAAVMADALAGRPRRIVPMLAAGVGAPAPANPTFPALPWWLWLRLLLFALLLMEGKVGCSSGSRRRREDTHRLSCCCDGNGIWAV